MFSHITLGYNNRGAAEVFYDSVLPLFGLQRKMQTEALLGFGPEEEAPPWIFMVRPFDEQAASQGNGFHVAFNAQSTDIVDQFHEKALAAGGTDDGPPGLRPHYSDDYYGAYVRDPDGNKLQAVCYLKGRSAGESGNVLSHITLGVNDLDGAGRFYEPVFMALGYERLMSEESPGVDHAFGIPGFRLPLVFVQRPFDGGIAARGNGQHAAFVAPTREAVDAFYAAALDLGGTDDGPPGLRRDYHPSYYAAYVRDPDGNKIQAVCHSPET